MITLKSHGFKFSRPEANIVFDVSYLVNPWREKRIREEEDAEKRKDMIMEFVLLQDGVRVLVRHLADVIAWYGFMFGDENIQIAFCCSAGEYRSPAMVELVAEELRRRNIRFIINQSKNSKI